MSYLKLISNASGDWTVAYFGEKQIYQGHRGYTPLLEAICEELGVVLERIEVTDEIMEEHYG